MESSGVGQQTQLNQIARADRNLAWIHIAFLCAITLTPFTTSLLAEFIHYRTVLPVYRFNILLLGVALTGAGATPLAHDFPPMTPPQRLIPPWFAAS
jgi:uncharacterized membrane protein